MKQLYNIYNSSGGKYEVVHEDKHGYLVNHPDYPKDSYRFWVKKNDPKSAFEEYKEPRTITSYVNVWEDNTTKEVFMGSVFKSRELALTVNKWNHNRLDVIEVKWTEKT